MTNLIQIQRVNSADSLRTIMKLGQLCRC